MGIQCDIAQDLGAARTEHSRLALSTKKDYLPFHLASRGKKEFLALKPAHFGDGDDDKEESVICHFEKQTQQKQRGAFHQKTVWSMYNSQAHKIKYEQASLNSAIERTLPNDAEFKNVSVPNLVRLSFAGYCVFVCVCDDVGCLQLPVSLLHDAEEAQHTFPASSCC